MVIAPGTALEKAIVEYILMIYIDKNIQQYHLIIPNMSINYKKQVIITIIKSGMQYFICHVSLKEYENLYKTLALKIYESNRA